MLHKQVPKGWLVSNGASRACGRFLVPAGTNWDKMGCQ